MGVIPGIDPLIPVTLLPVRIETRFSGPPESPQLQIRIYPDDVHIDRHDPRLTNNEVDAGTRYWTGIRAGTASEVAWAQLLKDTGPARAIWVREALTPTNDAGPPVFPPTPEIVGSAGIAPIARALPDSLMVRVRWPGGETTAAGNKIVADLEVGISFGDAPDPPPPPTPVPADDDATLVLDERMRWMVDYDKALAAGMAITVDLPPHTDFVSEVVVVGTQAQGADSVASLGKLIEAHRLSDGAAFIPAGTPTNNLADSKSGYSLNAVPKPGPSGQLAEGSVAAILAAAWNLDAAAFASIEGAGSLELEQASEMGRALFEATWGSYLRQQGQPGFDLNLLPEVYAHVTSFVRGGGPFPAIRLGRQPYAIAPVMARGDWVRLSEGRFVSWLSTFLPHIRPLWTSGIADQPSGPDLFALEPVSTRVRLRTTNMSSAISYLLATGNAGVDGNPEVTRRSLLAELGITDAMPSVFTQLFPKGAASLWLPMSADGDTEFNILSPAPKDANSVLGLLLRNSALRIAANATNEFAGLAGGGLVDEVSRVAMPTPIANLPAAAGHAIPVLSGFIASAAILTAEALAPAAGRDADGATFTIGDRLSDIVANPAAYRPDYGRYFNSDALAAFRDALVPLSSIPTARRAILAGEIIDCASHRYDAWVTSLASARLAAMRSVKQGVQLGAWGAVRAIRRRSLEPVPASETIPAGTATDPQNGGFVMAPSPRQAGAAGVLRAAWRAHGGTSGGALTPFATGLTSARIRQALKLADGMRNGQQLGALLGYLLERGIHDISGTNGIEIDWTVFELRRRYPLKIDTIDNAPQASAQRLVADGWKLAQAETAAPGSVVAAISSPPPGLSFDTLQKNALQSVIAEILATLDAFADLGLSESMYQFAGANLERAAAAADMIGRAAAPPDMFESVATPRGGRGIEQRVVITFGDDARPVGYATDTPRARLARAADAFVARRLGDLGDIRVHLLDRQGVEVAAPKLASLGLSALDIASLDLSSENVTLSNISAPETMPSAPNPNPGRAGVARLLLAAGEPAAVTVDFDMSRDTELLDLLDHAAAWHRALADRKPLSTDSFLPRAALESAPDNSALRGRIDALASELASATPAALKNWGITGADDNAALAAAQARIAAAGTETDAVAAARILLGGSTVVEGSMAGLPTEIETCVSDQHKLLGSRNGIVARWLQDAARVRPAVAAVNGALLRDDLAAKDSLDRWAAQTPAEPYVESVAASDKWNWVGLELPAALDRAPVTSAVIIGENAAGAVTGIELDAWTEVIPNAAGTGAVTANLTAPDARAPNLILIAVPPDTGKSWTDESLFSVVDEALELADCRMVDLDATRRVPALLPAVYVAEYDENDLGIRRFLSEAHDFPTRWVSAVTT